MSGKVPKGFLGVQMSFRFVEFPKILTLLDRALTEKWTRLEVEAATGTTLDGQFQEARKFIDPPTGQESRGIKLRFIRSIKFRDGEGQIQRLSIQTEPLCFCSVI